MARRLFIAPGPPPPGICIIMRSDSVQLLAVTDTWQICLELFLWASYVPTQTHDDIARVTQRRLLDV